jgi:actin-related protein
MLSKNNILIIGGTVLLAYFLFRKKESNKIVPTGEKKVVEFDPMNVQPMPWIGIPNYFSEVK